MVREPPAGANLRLTALCWDYHRFGTASREGTPQNADALCGRPSQVKSSQHLGPSEGHAGRERQRFACDCLTA